MKELEAGVYEQVINQQIERLVAGKEIVRENICPKDLSETLASYLKQLIRTTLQQLDENKEKEKVSIRLVNRIIQALGEFSSDQELSEKDLLTSELLKQVKDPNRQIERPETSLAKTSIIVGGGRGEKVLSEELKKEISSADEIYWMVSFIRDSGLMTLIDDLEKFVQHGTLKVLTTTYIGATEPKSLDSLCRLKNTEIKVEFDGNHSRLHAKVYYFKRKNGFSTAYIGSSNLSHSALRDGLEWNVKLTAQENPELFDKIENLFNLSWNDETFEPFTGTAEEFARLKDALNRSKFQSKPDIKHKYFFDLKPFLYQQEILDAIDQQRRQGINRNLVVAATGTGKTAIAAFDYKRLVEQTGEKIPLLFIAHRKEILEQARSCFQEVLHDDQFGELLVDGEEPVVYRHVFASVQSLNAKKLAMLRAEQFSMIIVDEAHHMAADSYQRILNHFTGFQYLLGLTATPERGDGKRITDDFDHRITAEIRLADAIDRQLLVPFNYFGQDDPVSLADCKWINGGYDVSMLEDRYTQGNSALKRVDKIIESIRRYLPDPENLKAIAFCAGIKHARFMADCFNKVGLSARCIAGTTSREERRSVHDDLKKGRVQIVTAVDVFNEGVDLPFLNSVLFLRPTQSLTVFLQQLGRGLRLYEGKDALTVLDFVGLANAHFNFESRLRAMLRPGSLHVAKQIESGQFALPIGCSINLQKQSRQIILDNIKQSYAGLKAFQKQLAWYLDELEEENISLKHFLQHIGVDPQTFYANIRTVGSFAGLRNALRKNPTELPLPPSLKGNGEKKDYQSASKRIAGMMLRFSQLDDRDLIENLLLLVKAGVTAVSDPVYSRIFYTCITSLPAGDQDPAPVIQAYLSIPWLANEIGELLEILLDQYRLSLKPLAWRAEENFPLRLHGTYSRAQIFTCLCPNMKVPTQAGVYYDGAHKIDILFVTINKSEKQFSPNTLYDDYAVTAEKFHWESQATTAESSPTGQRYINHERLNSRVLLFVRERKNSMETGETMPYRCFGFCRYVKHESEKPMRITWQLDEPLTARLLREAKPINNS